MSTSVIPIDRPALPAVKTPLFEILDHFSALMESYEGLEDEELRAQCEVEIQAQLLAEIRKVDNIANYLQHGRAQQAFAKAEAKRQQERAQRWEKREAQLLGYVQAAIEHFGLQRLEGQTNTFVLKKLPASVDITDETLIPVEYIRVKVSEEPDKVAIKAAIKEHGEDAVPGARLLTDRKKVDLQ